MPKNLPRPFKTTTSFYRNVKKHILLQNFNTRRNRFPTAYDVKDSEAVNNFPASAVFVNHSSYGILSAPPIIEDSELRLSTSESLSDIENNTTELLQDQKLKTNNFEDEDDEQAQLEEKLALIEELKIWALKHRIAHRAVNDLLSIFHSTCNIKYLPRDSRTLLATPIDVDIVKMGDVSYWHRGLKNSLENALWNIEKPVSISLIINIDGLPICRSSKNEFWPILCAIDEMPKIPIMVIGVYLGQCKPILEPFHNFFVDEYLAITKTGLLVNGHKISIKIKCFVCDTPARAFIKGVVGFNAYHGCIRCTSVGEYEINRMSFPRIDCEFRTDAGFRNRSDPDHHKEYTPLEKLPIDLITDFAVADSLHLLDLGVMKKLLQIWTTGCCNFDTKLSATDIQNISSLLKEYNGSMPIEIHRAVRGLDCMKFWKGLEFRTFLLYCGPVILKDYLHPEVYEHFLYLVCAVTICTSKQYLKYIKIANEILNGFIEKYIEIYGSHTISSNVHNLCYLTDDVKRFGHLPTFSAYPFENFLGHMKSMLRTGNRPLAQCAKRIVELSIINIISSEKFAYPIVTNENRNNKHQLSNCKKIFYKLQLEDGFTLTNRNKDKWFMTNQNEIVSLINATYFEEKLCIYGTSLKSKKDFFHRPINSSRINIFSSGGELNNPQLFELNNIKCKLISLPYQKDLVFLPLIHTLGLGST